MRKLTALLCLTLPFFVASAQDPKIKYGKINPQDLQTKVYSLDSSAAAIMISDMGETEIVGNNKGGFSLLFKRHARIHVLNKNGYDEANVEIPLYTTGTATESLENLKGVTYNLENGQLVEAKLEKANVFTEKRSKNLVLKKFTLPNVKEGSIIEYSYQIQSDFLRNLQPWAFQKNLPALWSEYRLSLPEFLDYTFLSQGYLPFLVKDKKDKTSSFNVTESGGTGATERQSFTCGVTDYRWAMKNIPELKEEGFTSTVDNYKAKIEFQLSAVKHPLTYRSMLGTWPEATKELLEDEDFGKNLSTANGWLGDIMKPLLAGASSDMEKARRIYGYVRDNLTCTSHYGLYISQPLKNILKTKNGRVSEINLLLVAMLRYADLPADPVILSTKENGFTYPLYPLISRFNYLVAQVTIAGRPFMLDATHPRLGFGRLPVNCYNGHSRIVNKEADELYLSADSLRERKVTALFLSTNDKGDWMGNINQTLGYNESYRTRERINTSGQDAYFKDIKKGYSFDIDILDPVIDSLSKLEEPLAIRYNFDMKLEKEDILYVSPMFSEGYKENPFKSAERLYPVEMPYTFDETYLATIHVPAGYELDELPKSIKVKFNEEGEGYFEYMIALSGSTVSLRSRIKMDRSDFLPEEYEILREFFNMIVAKQKEQIVFKKKK